MRLIQFRRHGDPKVRVGAEREGGGVVELASTMKEILGAWPEAAARNADGPVLDPAQIQVLAPILDPEKLICVGLNYRDHCAEQNLPPPQEPIIFSKFPSAITGPYDDIIRPGLSQAVDWEAELAFVIGRGGRDIPESVAMAHIAGFTVANDVSARDWQLERNGKQWLLGKSFDSFCPLGPALVTSDDITDPHGLGIRCLVNGELMQSSNTQQMIFQSAALVAWVSRFVTLSTGDVFLTGTPPGVGCFRKPPVYLKKGDVVECQIDQIGSIINKVV